MGEEEGDDHKGDNEPETEGDDNDGDNDKTTEHEVDPKEEMDPNDDTPIKDEDHETKVRVLRRRMQKVPTKTYGNASEGLDLIAPVTELKASLKSKRSQLSKITTNIQKAHDDAKKNDERSGVLLGEEKTIKKSAEAAISVLKDLQASTG